jgi:oligopeptide transport system substrate-binding protein
MTRWDHDSLIVLEKNGRYHDSQSVTMGRLNFYLSDDANNMLVNFKNGSWQLIDNVPINEIKSLSSDPEYKDELAAVSQIGTYYICWNVNEPLLPKGSSLSGDDAARAEAEIRRAISLLLDRNYIVENIAQGGQVAASSFVAMGMTDADGSQFYKNAGDSESFWGYYDVSAASFEANVRSAVKTLKKYYAFDEGSGKFTNVPSLSYLYNESDAHKAIGEYIQAALGSIGINLTLETQEWNTFLNTRKNGDYSIARNGWLADYNDPVCFLDKWTSDSGNNDVQLGRGENRNAAIYSLDLRKFGYDIFVERGTWSDTYDRLIEAIKDCSDREARYGMMHLAEDMLMETGCITPLYFYTDLYLLDSSVAGFFSNPLGYKYFMYTSYR